MIWIISCVCAVAVPAVKLCILLTYLVGNNRQPKNGQTDLLYVFNTEGTKTQSELI